MERAQRTALDMDNEEYGIKAERRFELWLDDWAHLLDASQPSQQSIAEMREGLSERVRLLNQVAEGFYAHWLKLAGL